jgi:thymidylate synthase (FAD)
MEFVPQSFQILYPANRDAWIRDARLIERAARVCYKSEDRMTDDSYEKIIKMLLSNSTPHESPLEHAKVSVALTVSRAIQQEITRHRLASYSIESTRYVNYEKKGISFVMPADWSEMTADQQSFYEHLAGIAEENYKTAIKLGMKPQRARDVLPLSLKSDIVMTANWREWRTIFKLRCESGAHPDIRDLMTFLREEFISNMPCAFGDLR